jgi:transposase InsO family protein
MVEVE